MFFTLSLYDETVNMEDIYYLAHILYNIYLY